jgi:hypothetical protein
MITGTLFFSPVVASSHVSSSKRPRIVTREPSLSFIFLIRSQRGPNAFTEKLTQRELFSARVSYTLYPTLNRTESLFSEYLSAGVSLYPFDITTGVPNVINIVKTPFLQGLPAIKYIYFNLFSRQKPRETKKVPISTIVLTDTL